LSDTNGKSHGILHNYMLGGNLDNFFASYDFSTLSADYSFFTLPILDENML